MLKDYVLSNEVIKRMGFAHSNISMAIKKLEPGQDYLKFGGTTFLSKNPIHLKKYITNAIKNNTYSDLTGYIPLIYLERLTGTKLKDIKERFTSSFYFHNGNKKKLRIYDIKRICKKDFVKFNKEFHNILSDNKIIKSYDSLSNIQSLLEEGLIQGYLPISKRKCLIWYSV